jgi:pimeloyl-ACP methyl ester carboxylesterase
MNEEFAPLGEVELCYERFGDPAAPAVLLIMGLGTQMIAWHEDFCGMLVDRGFHVIRFDNRDCGRSTWFDSVPPPGMLELLRRKPRRPAYTLDDMADDAAGLLDHLEIERAHIVGVSMGGMIAQVLAGRHRDRVHSLVSIMASVGSRWSGQPAFRAYPLLLRPLPRHREAYIKAAEKVFRVIGSPGFPRDEAHIRELLGRSWERGLTAAGTGRQMAAILASGNRTSALRRITAPTLVIHGTADKLVSVSGGRATARAIPGARLMLIEGMGHDLPRGAWPRLVDGIAATANAATRERAPVR